MTKLEIEAIRALPQDYVRDGICVFAVAEFVCAMHPEMKPLVYKNGQWREMKITCLAPDQSETQAHPKAAGSD